MGWEGGGLLFIRNSTGDDPGLILADADVGEWVVLLFSSSSYLLSLVLTVFVFLNDLARHSRLVYVILPRSCHAFLMLICVVNSGLH
ncbi:hypothetical protein DFP73DRAFT_545279 [Morchella snyderi]|nr:hypothetical protein DFP73DRAFT_545279 [Morchella snyderi]